MAIPQSQRDADLAWCKQRAEEYLRAGDAANALSSFISDLQKGETRNHPAISLTMALLMSGQLETVTQVREHIQGYN